MFKKIILAVILIGAIVAWVAPIAMMPGFFIGGSTTPAPSSWEDTGAIDEVRLKVGGLIPRVVIIWVVQVEGELYVTGAKDSGWVTRLGDGGEAELRIGDNTYPVVAERQSENLDKLINAWYDKYRPNYPDIVGAMSEASTEPRSYAIFKLARS